MTTYTCRCGSVHDSATQAPCPETFTLVPSGMYALDRPERFMIVSALRHRFQKGSSKRLQTLIDKLKATRDETRATIDFIREMAARSRGG